MPRPGRPGARAWRTRETREVSGGGPSGPRVTEFLFAVLEEHLDTRPFDPHHETLAELGVRNEGSLRVTGGEREGDESLVRLRIDFGPGGIGLCGLGPDGGVVLVGPAVGTRISLFAALHRHVHPPFSADRRWGGGAKVSLCPPAPARIGRRSCSPPPRACTARRARSTTSCSTPSPCALSPRRSLRSWPRLRSPPTSSRC